MRVCFGSVLAGMNRNNAHKDSNETKLKVNNRANANNPAQGHSINSGFPAYFSGTVNSMAVAGYFVPSLWEDFRQGSVTF